MRRLIVSEFVTLDGVMEAPGGVEGHPHSGIAYGQPALAAARLAAEEASPGA